MTRFRERRRAVRGIPSGISLALLNSVCAGAFHSTLRESAYLQLSGWKGAGAYRLFLRLHNRLDLSLIFKNASYREADIPALRGLPVSPGPPEYLVAGFQNEPLQRFLPVTYWRGEVKPETSFQYLFEDLSCGYYCLSGSPNVARDLLFAAEQLPAVQRAFAESLSGEDTSSLLSFDHDFSKALVPYAFKSLEHFLDQTGDSSVQRVMDKWSSICDVYLDEHFLKDRPKSYIHGDYNGSNIHISPRERRIKVVDWEWAAQGTPHADLVALVQGSDAGVQMAALRIFGAQFSDYSPEEHERWYRWCLIERSLLDAAFLARQHLESERIVEWMPARIRRAVNQVIDTCEEICR